MSSERKSGEWTAAAAAAAAVPGIGSPPLSPVPLAISRDVSVDASGMESEGPLSPTSSTLSDLSACALPLTPLSRDVSLPLAAELHHSFSQPELYRLMVSPAQPQLSDGHHSSTTAAGINHSTEGYNTSLDDSLQQRDALEHSHAHMYDDDAEHGHGLLPPGEEGLIDTSAGSGRFEFEHDTGAVVSSPTMQQHAATHARWREEHQQEEQAEEARLEAELQAMRKEKAQQSAEDETSALLTPTGANQLKRGASDLSDSSEDDLPELTRLQLIGMCLPAAAVMVGWAVGEALLLPYLLSLGVSPTLANFAFLVNPLFGLVLQPMFGRWSDHCTSRFGRRRPFLLFFCLGSVFGLSLVVWSAELAYLLSGGRMGAGSLLQIVLIFIGFATMDHSHDELLMPARALLNDCLPDEQTDQGNAYFACISSLGSCLGLALTILPLERYLPWSLLELPVRATFTTATCIILTCNLTTLVMTSGLDQPYEVEGEGEGASDKDANESPPQETSSLLGGQERRPSYGAASEEQGEQRSDAPDLERRVVEGTPQRPTQSIANPSKSDAAEPAEPAARWCCCFPDNPLAGIGDAYNILPRPLKFIWLLQLVWWYCVLHVNLWWTSWCSVELFGAVSPESGVPHHHPPHAHQSSSVDASVAIRLATVGLLVQAVLSFPSSAALPYFNRRFGITNFYHASAIVFGLAVCSIGFATTYWHTIVLMAVSGLALPPIFSSSYILVEVYASEADEDSDDEDESSSDEEEEETEPSPPALTSSLQPGAAAASPSPSSGPRRSSRRPSALQPPAEGRSGPSPSPVSGRDSRASPMDDDEDSSEFTTATLESKRGTITALFNITMIIAQTVVGLLSGFIIDWCGNITIVFYVSGFLLVASNVAVLALRLSKPSEVEEAEEEEEEEEEKEEKLAATARKQVQAHKIEKLEHFPPPLSTPHPPMSPPLHDYIQAYESLPHIAPGMAEASWVRPLGEEHPHARPPHHLHAASPAVPQLPSLRRTQLKRSLSAPDVRIATRFLRKRRQAKAAAAAVVKPPARVALFQPHGLTPGMRRDLLRGARPRLRASRNARLELDGSDAGSQLTAAQHAAAAEQRQVARAAHHKRLEERRLEQLRERARLFGIKVATRAAQIKAHRAKHRRSERHLHGAAAGASTGAHDHSSASSGHHAHASTSSRRNNQAPRQPLSAIGASTTPWRNSDAQTEERKYLSIQAPAASANTSVASSTAASPSSPPPSSFLSAHTLGRVHWALLSDAAHGTAATECCPTASSIPLPAPGSEQERALIERLAQESVTREQHALAAMGQLPILRGPLPAVQVHVPLLLPSADDAPPRILLHAATPDHTLHTPDAGAVILEDSESIVIPYTQTPPLAGPPSR